MNPIEICSGHAASSGIATGKAVILEDVTEGHKIKPGSIVIAKMTTPILAPFLLHAVALVTDIGGILSHAAIVAREMGVPAVVGTNVATAVIKEGQMLQVNGSTGKVYLVE